MTNLYYIIKYYFLVIISPLYKKKCKNVWLISERGDEARDNGYYFYKYLKENHKEIKVKYVISQNSKDLNLIDPSDRIYFRTFKHYMFFINSKYLISSHYMGYSPVHWMFSKLDKKGLLYLKGKRIFLQHGITYNMVKSLIERPIDLFITASDIEKKFIEENFKLKKNVVKTLGFSRFDFFGSKETNTILIMPTWRRNLNGISKDDFRKSEYYKKWNSILNSKKLETLLAKNSIKLLFYPHYEMQKYIDLFNANSNNIVFANAEKYFIHDLIDECRCFITDYSSTFFDAAYANKPIIYYNFDYENFYNTHYEKGYFDIRNDGFGKSCINENELIKELEKIINNNFNLEEKYRKKRDEFYKYNDKNNNERIYNAIEKL